MSFIGSINAETRKWLGNNGPAFDGRQVYVGCSGNFTVEQLISRYAPKARIWGNDVSLYSGALGAYLADQPFNLTIREEDYQWLEAFMQDEEGKAATVMVLLEALKYEKANNLFKARQPCGWRIRPHSSMPGAPGPNSMFKREGRAAKEVSLEDLQGHRVSLAACFVEMIGQVQIHIGSMENFTVADKVNIRI